MRKGLVAVVAGLLLIFSAVAQAAYGPGASLVSANPATQVQSDENAQTAVISQDGRYVVFQTTARNLYPTDDPGDPPGETRLGGIFRRDLTTGALDVVAYGNRVKTTGELIWRGAQNPSVSAEGRYIAFSSGWQLVPADVNPNVDIYVRDMTQPISSPDAYRLVSAKDGGTTPAAWASTIPAAFTSDVTPGASISADGTKVVFRTGVASDLPNEPDKTTSSGQIFVRDLTTNKTTLVTRQLSDGSPAGGALGQPAAISADGTTVAWPGLNASLQTKFIPGREIPNDQQWRYYLWRRIVDGPGAPTRRITGAVDLDDTQCTDAEQQLFDPNLPAATGPCYGPFSYAEGNTTYGDISGKVPALSADGYTIAFLTGSPVRGTQAAGGEYGADLFVTDMHPGVSRKQGTVALTTHSGTGGNKATDAAVSSAVFSADGSHIAFVTQRTTFLLASPRLVGPPLPLPVHIELYVVDRARAEIYLASRGLDGTEANNDIEGLPSLSGDGKKLAFTTGATNLFTGDANDRADAFVVIDGSDSQAQAESSEPPFSGYSSPLEGGGVHTVTLELSSSHRKGSLQLRVRVPGAGTVSATARAHGATVARRSAHVEAAGTAKLVLRPKTRFRKLLRRHGRLAATVTVRFMPAKAAAPLTRTQRVTFKR